MGEGGLSPHEFGMPFPICADPKILRRMQPRNPTSRKEREKWGTRLVVVAMELLRFRFQHQVVVEGGLDCGLGAVDCAVVFLCFVI